MPCSVSIVCSQFLVLPSDLACRLIGSILCLGMESGMWFYDFFGQRKENRTFKYRLAFAMAALVGFAGIFICGAGVGRRVVRFSIIADP